jgi:Holliday junction DNA helicase RuvA
MYAYLSGTIAYKQMDYFVLDVQGVGYKIYCAPVLLARIPSQGEKAKVYTHMVVREDLIALYGFPTQEELSMFEMLLSVSGIGPKVAGAIAATIEPTHFAMAVLTSDIALISSVKGVGKKGAERVILELKDKLKGVNFQEEGKPSSAMQKGTTTTGTKFGEACSAMVVLGYSAYESNQSVSKVFRDELALEEIIKLALKELIR